MVKKIELTQGKFALVDAEDFAWARQLNWFLSGNGYAARMSRVLGRRVMIYLHREIATRAGIKFSKGDYVDHINRNKLDDRRINLRAASPRQSSFNVSKTNRHGFRGVRLDYYWSKKGKRYLRSKPWAAQIHMQGRTIVLGRYATVEEAAKAYDEAARKYHGEFALLNFPDTETEN